MNIKEFKNADLEIQRTGPGRRVKGRWRSGELDTFDAIAVVVPATPKEIEQFPEGIRGADSKKVFTECELRITDESKQTRGDFFCYKGGTYEVFKVSDWADTDLPFYESFAFKQDDQEGRDI